MGILITEECPLKLINLTRIDNDNCRVYYRDAENRLFCYQQSTRGSYELFVCSRDGEPSHAIDQQAHKIDVFPSTKCATAIGFQSWYLKEHTGREHRVYAVFHPEAWVNDNAIEVDPGATEIDVTGIILGIGSKAALALVDNRDSSDVLRESAGIDEWIRDWSGPFQVSCEFGIRSYYEATT